MAAEATTVSPSRLLKIGEVARRAGIGVESLRFYESRGLIDPAGRTHSGYRIYDSSVFQRLSFIKKAQAVGFTLEEIAWIIAEAQRGQRPCTEVRQLARERLAELDRRIRELQRYRGELKQTVDAWDRTREKDGVICGLIEELRAGQIRPPQEKPASLRRSNGRKRRTP